MGKSIVFAAIIFGGAAVIVSGVGVFGSMYAPGRYQIVDGSQGSKNRLDTSTGELLSCIDGTFDEDRKFHRDGATCWVVHPGGRGATWSPVSIDLSNMPFKK